MTRLSALDASFLAIETDAAPMHIGSVAVFEGPAPGYDNVLRLISGKLALVPRYRQVPRFVPWSLGRPVWQDDRHFRLEYHVRHTALPSPGGDSELKAHVGWIMAQRLDRSKPLWELWLVEGLEDGHWALVSKTHHAIVDGVSGTDLMATIFDATPEPAPVVAQPWRPEPPESAVRVAAEALVDLVVSPVEAVGSSRVGLTHPRRLMSSVLGAARGAAETAKLVRPSGGGLNGPLSPHRSYTWARGSLADVKEIRRALGGTVNDVVLASITRGFRDLLVSRGEAVTGRVVRTMVPVSVRRAEESGGVYNNRVSAMFAELPVGVADAAERLQAVRRQMDGLKDSKQAVAGEVLTSLGGFAPALLLDLGTRLAMRTPQQSIETITTNVPGPQYPLYVGGRRMLDSFPYVPLGGRIRQAIAIFSYVGRLTFGVTGDADHVPDIDVLARGVEDGLAELLKAAREAAGQAPSRIDATSTRKISTVPQNNPK